MIKTIVKEFLFFSNNLHDFIIFAIIIFNYERNF